MSLLDERIALMVRLGKYLADNSEDWQNVVDQAHRMNAWFTPEYSRLAVGNIAAAFLQEDKLRAWLAGYPVLQHPLAPAKTVGLVMAGNIPLVGFHDFLCVYLSGHRLRIKLSSKDTVLWEHILRLLGNWDPRFGEQVDTNEMLKGCDAYIATGSNNSARYFEQYFQKYPHIIRKNRTSVAVLDGTETREQLDSLAQDVCTYFGLGCRNVTKLYVPEGYPFETLLPAFDAFKEHEDHHKYKNNYDFQLAIYLLNKVQYMSSGSLLLVPGDSPFAPIAVLHYEYYTDKSVLLATLAADDRLQCITLKAAVALPAERQSGAFAVPAVESRAFGDNQQPQLNDYADGIDTMAFLASLY
ncbi:acyl-CoA reductase [Taibaiella koreensis]|uniref:acyl-CoA reductase n=1 Tax=Taibaiella koreensis TaxID=1268548 RepID=UPI000E59CA8F|nr:acyl-CoA reductase [Taibaiella koreensis]